MKKLILSIALTLTVSTIPVYSHAAVPTYKLLEPLPCIGDTQTCDKNNQVTTVNLESYIGYVFKLMIALAAAVAVFRITFAGFKYMTIDAVYGKSEAKKDIEGAIYGLIMIFASYLILQTIDPRLVSITTKIPDVTPAEAIDFNGLFSNIMDLNLKLDSASSSENRRKVEALRAAAATSTDEEESTKLMTQALDLERAAKEKSSEIVATVNMQAALDYIQSNTEATLSADTRMQMENKLNALKVRGDWDIKALTDLGDTAGVQKLKNTLAVNIAIVQNQYDFTDAFKNMQSNYSVNISRGAGYSASNYGSSAGSNVQSIAAAEAALVKSGDTLIVDIKKRLANPPAGVTDSAQLTTYRSYLNDQLTQVNTVVDPHRPKK